MSKKKQEPETFEVSDIELPEAKLEEFGLDGTDAKSMDRKAVKEAIGRVMDFKPVVEMVQIDQIHGYENNPRINEAAVAPVKESISRFGMDVPITIDKNNVIVTGHTRVAAMKELGIREVPCIRLTHLTDEEVQAFRLVDNRTAEFAKWDWDKLGEELREVVESGIDMSIFDFQIKNETKNLDDPDLDDVPEEPEIPFSQRGDIWILGDHRLVCGDSTDKQDMAMLMGDEKADMVLTDPPYNVAYDDGQHGQIMNDSMAEDAFHSFLVQVYARMAENLKPGGAFYIFHADSEGLNFRSALKQTEGMLQKECLIWVKNSFTLGRQDYQWQHEPCIYGWKQGEGHYFVDDRSQATIMKLKNTEVDKMTEAEAKKLLKEILAAKTDVLEYDKPKKNDLHPTMKPVKMVGQLIANSSHVGDIVLDQFGGSGTTLIACDSLGRKARLMELDPKYVDVIVHRWEQLNETHATLIRNGEPYLGEHHV